MTRASLIILALAIALSPGLAGAKQPAKTTKHPTAPHAARNAPRHVACTKLGCFPVAPNCYPRTQLDWWGNPTGYDQIICR